MKATTEIKAGYKNGKTFLTKCYCTPPFKVANITEDKNAKTLHLMMMNSSPGVLCGDTYEIKIELEEEASLQIHSQSYQRLFTMQNSASQKMEVRLGEHGSFTYLPHPVVPHKASNFRSVNQIFLSKNNTLTWGEIFTCGRKMNGEVFQFSKYHTTTEIFLNNKLLLKENLFMQPLVCNVTGMGLLEGFTHQASFIYLHDDANIEAIKQKLTEILHIENEIEYGITSAPIPGIVVRILGQKSEQLFNCFKKMEAAISLLCAPKKIAIDEH